MRIALISGANVVHTVRWANGLSKEGHEVHVISKNKWSDPFDSSVSVHVIPGWGASGYFTMVLAVRRLLKELKPDIVNAHYASGYGTTARLVNYKPYVLSVWGSDVYDFPHRSLIHKWLVKKNLRAADQVASTSHCMAEETRKLLPELSDITITPFGVDLIDYALINPASPVFKPKVVIGTVKTLKPKYGVDTLIEAFAFLVKSLNSIQTNELPELELRIVGGGAQEAELKTLAHRLGIINKVSFVGQVPHSEVPEELEKLDIYVALSRFDSESFGVAILEAGAAGRPVVVSDAGGLPEVTIEGVTGFIVERENPQAAAQAMQRLVLDPRLRFNMGVAAQKHVAEKYSWAASLEIMVKFYSDAISKYKLIE